MNTCKRCGSVFEGKFCPECGQKLMGDTCPQCGCELNGNVKFCPECGCNLGSPQSNGNGGVPSLAQKAYFVLRYVPIVLIMLCAVLLPLLYLAPLTQAEGLGELMSEGPINVYSFDDDFFGVSIAFLVVAAIAVLSAIVALRYTFAKSKRDNKITLFGATMPTGGFAALLAVVVVYLPALIIAAIAMAKAADLNEQMGGGVMEMVSAGAAPKAVLSLAVIFAVFAVGCAVARAWLGKKYPSLRGDAGKKAVKAEPCSRPLLSVAYANAKLRRVVTSIFACTFLTSLAIVLLMWLQPAIYIVSPHWAIIICAGVTAIAVILSLCVGVDNWSPEKFLIEVQKKVKNADDKMNEVKDKKDEVNEGRNTRLGIKKVIAFLIIPIMYGYAFNLRGGLPVYMYGYIVGLVYIVAATVVYVIAQLILDKQSRALAVRLFGSERPQPHASLCVEYDKERERELLEMYKVAKRNHIAIDDDDATKSNTLKRRVGLAVASIVFTVASVVCAIVSPVVTDKFSPSYLSSAIEERQTSKTNIGIYTYFGKPDDRQNLKDDIVVLTYYDGEFAGIAKQIKDLEAQLKKGEKLDEKKRESLSTQLENLKIQAEKMTFTSLNVSFKSGRTYNTSPTITQNGPYIFALNTATTYGGTAKPKTTKSVRLLNVKNTIDSKQSNIYSEIYYMDGSYKYELVPTSAFADFDQNNHGKQKVKWSDDWGSYEATLDLA